MEIDEEGEDETDVDAINKSIAYENKMRAIDRLATMKAEEKSFVLSILPGFLVNSAEYTGESADIGIKYALEVLEKVNLAMEKRG